MFVPDTPEPAPDEHAADPKRHLAPDGGLQTYAGPDPSAALGVHIEERLPVQVTETRGAWAHLQSDDAEATSLGWVDGRQLIPPVSAGTNLHSGATLVGSSSSVIVTPGMVIGALASVGVMIGAAVQWTALGSANAFDIPVGVLFDAQNTDVEPKLGYFLIGFGLLGLLFSFVRGAGILRAACGGLALAAAILYFVRIGDSISSFSSVDVTDVVGAGAWITGVSGLVLLVSPISWTIGPSASSSGA